jgi:hypothetical protein
VRSGATPLLQPEAPARADRRNDVYPRRSRSGGAAHGCIEWRAAITHLARVAIFPVLLIHLVLPALPRVPQMRAALANASGCDAEEGRRLVWEKYYFKGCLGAAER